MTTLETPRSSGALVGIGWMVLTGILFVAVTGIVRHLGSDLPAVEAAFIRYAFGLVLVLPVLIKLRYHYPGHRTMSLFGTRGLIHGCAVMLWFYAMARIPIAEVTAIGYTAPLFTTIGAALFLGEKLHARRILAILAGFLGALIILRPGLEVIKLGALAQLTAAPLFAVSFLLAKRLTSTQDPAIIVAMLSVFCTIVLLPGALWQWRTPTGTELFWLLLTAVIATIGHYTLTRAIEAAPITVTQPISFLQLVWATILGFVMFGEAVDPIVILGGGVIIGAATYISHREMVAAGRAEPKLPPH